jgi:hypothetical protein
VRPFSLQQAEPWWGSLGASLLLHGAVVAGLMLALLRQPAIAREAPDLWQGEAVLVDTVHEGPGDSTGGEPTPAPAAAVPVNHSETQKQNETVEHEETLKHIETLRHGVVGFSNVARATPKTPPKTSSPQKIKEPSDPNQALLAKVMGFRPDPGNTPTESPVSSGAATNSQRPSGVVGGSAAQASVRNLPKAFTRALANAAAGDAARYSQMASGKLEEARITVEVGEKGEVTGHALNREASVRMKELVRRTLASLGAGQFALRETQVSAGTLRLEVEVWLSGDSEGNERVTEIGYEAPRPERDGKAYFLLGSSWRFEAKVRELR